MIVAGFGFRGAATADSLRSALWLAGGALPLDRLAAPADKAEEAGLVELAAILRLPVTAVGAAAISRVRTPTRSRRVLALRGTGSVAEAVALVAAGDGARLLSRRHVSEDRLATCAIAVGHGG